MTDRIPASHAEHDLLLVAALAAGDLDPADREPAEHLVSTCAECALLAADLRAIATATAVLPPRTRPRDFSLRAEDAARLRRRGWRGLVAAFAGQRSAALKPLATGLTTLGIAGLLLAAMPAVQLGGSAAAPSGPPAPAAAASGGVRDSDADIAGNPAASGSPGTEGRQYSGQSEQPLGPVPVRGPASSPLAFGATPGPDGGAGEDRALSGQPKAAAGGPQAPSPLVVLSSTLLVLGLGLFGLRWTARRLSRG